MIRKAVAVALFALPLAAPLQAFACEMHDAKQASSCAQGYEWNTDAGKCIPVVTG